MPTNYEQDLKELDQIIEVASILFSELNTNSKIASYQLMMGLFASVIEQTKSFNALLNIKLFSSTQAIARNILELYIDIKNVEKDGNYTNYLWAEYFDREKELAKTKEKQKKYRKEREKSFSLYKEEESYKLLSIHEKFKLADMKDEYQTVYTKLSAHTHSGVLLLMNRIFRHDKEKTKIGQDLFKTEPSMVERYTVPLVSYYLLDACAIIAKGHDEEALKIVQEFRNHLLNKSKITS